MKKLNRNINKKSFKQFMSKCSICDENHPSLLDVHRIIPGKDNGKYTEYNSVCLCCKCHRLCHNGDIEITGIFDSTSGKVLIYKQNQVEHIVNI